MALFAALTNALIAGRSAQKDGQAVGRSERAAAEQAARKAEQESESALQKALFDRQRVDNDTARVGLEGQRVGLEGQRVTNDTERLGFERGKSSRESEKADYDKTQRPNFERLTASIISRNHATASHSRRLAVRPTTGGGTVPYAHERSARSGLAVDAVRAQAARDGIDVAQLTGHQDLLNLVDRAVTRLRQDPAFMARARATGITMDDYLVAAHSLRGSRPSVRTPSPGSLAEAEAELKILLARPRGTP